MVGIDPPLQCWFVQVYGPDEDPVKDIDMASQGQVLDVMNRYADMSSPLAKRAYDFIVLDLDPQRAVDELKKKTRGV